MGAHSSAQVPTGQCYLPRVAWVVYMVRCRDGSLYTGCTNDLDRRVAAHNAGRGARYTRSRRPVTVVWTRRVKDRSKALSLEARLKQRTRDEKLALIRPSPRAGGRSSSMRQRPQPPRGRACGG